MMCDGFICLLLRTFKSLRIIMFCSKGSEEESLIFVSIFSVGLELPNVVDTRFS